MFLFRILNRKRGGAGHMHLCFQTKVHLLTSLQIKTEQRLFDLSYLGGLFYSYFTVFSTFSRTFENFSRISFHFFKSFIFNISSGFCIKKILPLFSEFFRTFWESIQTLPNRTLVKFYIKNSGNRGSSI